MEKKGDMALEHATTVTKLQPGNPQSWYVMAVVQAQLGDKKGSIDSLKNSLNIDPTFQAAKEALLQIETVKSST